MYFRHYNKQQAAPVLGAHHGLGEGDALERAVRRDHVKGGGRGAQVGQVAEELRGSAAGRSGAAGARQPRRAVRAAGGRGQGECGRVEIGLRGLAGPAPQVRQPQGRSHGVLFAEVDCAVQGGRTRGGARECQGGVGAGGVLRHAVQLQSAELCG